MSIGKHRNVPDSAFNKRQLRIGTKIELEHTHNRAVAKQIAKDHLSEFSDYYTHLIKMEKSMKKTKEYDWKPGWKYVHKRLESPSKCKRGSYASKKKKGIQVVICKIGSKMKAQAIRIPVKKFKKLHPSIWRKLNKR